MTNKKKYMSLYCGCGGFDTGFIAPFYECIGAFDINTLAVENYNNNFLHRATVADLSLNFDTTCFAPDLIISGSPCQGFSTAGKRNLDDPRNILFKRSVDIVNALKPKVFIAENVVGILSGKHKIEYMDYAVSLLRSAGYKTHVCIIDCRDIGMAQMRKRAILFAWQSDNDIKLETQKNAANCIQKALEGLSPDTPNNSKEFCLARGKDELIAQHIKPGQKLSNVRGGERAVHTWDIPKVFGVVSANERTILETVMRLRRRQRKRDWGDADPISFRDLKSYVDFEPSKEVHSLLKKGYLKTKDELLDLANGFNGKYRRLRLEEPSLTVDTRFGTPALVLHPKENRAFTAREAARLQGFSDNFSFSGPSKTQYELIGNAVPPPLSKYIESLIRELWN